MEVDTWNIELLIRGVLQVVLLASSAVFSGSETALFSLSRIDLQQLRYRRDPTSESIHAMLDEPRRLIISILCGNELVNIASSVNMAAILLILFGHDAGWLNILVMVPLLLLIGEVTPKTIAVNYPLGFAQQGQRAHPAALDLHRHPAARGRAAGCRPGDHLAGG